jgi:outer membrane protein
MNISPDLSAILVGNLIVDGGGIERRTQTSASLNLCTSRGPHETRLCYPKFLTLLKEPFRMSVRFGLRLCAVCLALATITQVVSAQAKVAIINLQKAVLDSDEIQKASKDLEAKYKPRQQELEKLQNEIQVIQQQLQTNAGKLNPQAEADLNAQGAKKQRDLQRKSEDLQGDVDRERNEILGKSSQKMSAVVKKLAEEKGYDVVIDVSTTIYFKPALEITSDAMAAYNKTYPVK